MGLELDIDSDHSNTLQTPTPLTTLTLTKFNDAPLPPYTSPKITKDDWSPQLACRRTPLPLRETAHPCQWTAAAARVSSQPKVCWSSCNIAADIVSEFSILKTDMALIYMLPDPYYEAFKEVINLR
jgi:hypothetical protein